MARESSDWSIDKFQRYIKEGRGQGQLELYKPWLNVNYKSRGRVSRVYSRKTNRVHYMMTDAQANYFNLLEWDSSVIDVREQYPIFQFGDIARELDTDLIKRLIGKNDVPHVMLTTFLITAKDEKGEAFLIARNLKDSNELNNKTNLQRFELIRRFWLSQSVDWGIVTPNEIPLQKARNIEWVLPSLNYHDFGLSEKEVDYYTSYLMETIHLQDMDIKSILQTFEREMKLEPGIGLVLFRYLIANRMIKVNMYEEINIRKTPKQLDLLLIDKGGISKKNVVSG